MNAQDPQNPPASPAPAAADDTAAPKAPARKRAPRVAKPVADLPPAAPAPEPVSADAPAEAGALAKPKRTRKKAADPAADAADAGAGAAPVAEAAPARPARKRARPVAEAVQAVAGVAPAAAPALAVDSPAVAPVDRAPAPSTAPDADASGRGAGQDSMAAADGESGGPAPAGAGGEPGDAGDTAEGRRRRNRNRRRGRRGGDRGDDNLPGDGAAAADGGAVGPRAKPLPSDADFTVVTVAAGDDDEDEDGGDGESAGQALASAQPAQPARPAPDAASTFANVVSGVYDEEAGEVAPEPEKRVLLPDPDAPKLHKVLAQAGVGSRRDMEQLIADGKVEVNGHTAHVGQRVSFGDRISVGGRLIKVRIAPLPARVIAYHKPVGEVVTHDDPQHRPTVFRRLPRLPQGKWQSVGRLDINTEGLLLFTNSGELANQLMHPRFGVEREYAVRVLGTLDPAARQKLLDGVDIDGQRAAFKSIEDGGGEGVNHWYRVVITEGRNREVRKLFDKVGLGVSRLIRIRYGCVVLPRGLKRGVYVDMNQAEVGELRRLAARPGSGQGHKNAHAQGPSAGQGRHGGPRPPRPEGRDGDGPRGQRPPRDKGRGGPREDQVRRDPAPQQQAGRDKRREPRPRDPDAEFAAIPNPLMQTFDKRAIREARQPRREYSDDGPIPNPLEQTYDKRGVQKPRGLGGWGGGRKGGGGPEGGQPDPMKTSLGYIGADAFVRKFQGNGGGGGGGGGGGRGRKRGGR